MVAGTLVLVIWCVVEQQFQLWGTGGMNLHLGYYQSIWRGYENNMKGRTKPKKFGIAATVLLAALLMAAAIVPAIGAI